MKRVMEEYTKDFFFYILGKYVAFKSLGLFV